jgi:pyruvate dehydrogenase E1 component beta subunit
VAVPSTPYDAKGLLASALRDNNFCIITSHKLLYGSKGRKLVSSQSLSNAVPDGEYFIPFGQADVKRTGRDVTVVATLLMLHRSMEAAAELEAEGISVEVVDPRTLVPLDTATIIESVKKTGRLVIVEEDSISFGWGAEVAASVAEHAIGYLDAPIIRVATPDMPMPAAPSLEALVLPNQAKIKAAILRAMGRS